MSVIFRGEELTPRQRAFDRSVRGLDRAIQMGAQMYQQQQERERQDELTRRQQALQGLQLQQQLAQSGLEVTPEVQEQVQGAIKSGEYGSLGGLFSQAAQARQQREMSDLAQRRQFAEEERMARAQEKDLERQFKMQQLEESRRQAELDRELKRQQFQARTESEARKKIKTPEQKLEKLGAESRKAVGSIASGLDAIENMKVALAKGDDADYITADTPFVGGLISDTPFSENQRLLAEVVGRLQSGGAINSEEEKRFMAMGPRPGDSKAVQARKLDNQKKFLENKLTAFSLESEQLPQLGFKVGDTTQTPLQLSAPGEQPMQDRAAQRRARIQELRMKQGMR